MTTAGQRRVTWRDRLRPVSEALADVHRLAIRTATEASDEELDRLIQACRKPTVTNCWWATYDAAPILLDACVMERKSRNRARAARRNAARG